MQTLRIIRFALPPFRIRNEIQSTTLTLIVPDGSVELSGIFIDLRNY